jgi:hypothetical protein
MTGESGASAFVSTHFKLPASEVVRFLTRHKLEHRVDGGEIVCKSCPFCRPTKNMLDNMFKLYIRAENGVFFCHRCGSKGSWFDLTSKVGGFDPNEVVKQEPARSHLACRSVHAHSTHDHRRACASPAICSHRLGCGTLEMAR